MTVPVGRRAESVVSLVPDPLPPADAPPAPGEHHLRGAPEQGHAPGAPEDGSAPDAAGEEPGRSAEEAAREAAAAATTRLLLESLERLPVQQSAALQVIRLADDPGCSSADVALGIAADPVLTARVLKLANSAYYGLSGRVSTTSFAVTLLGRDTIRAIAAAAAAGLAGDPAQLPPGFWAYSSATAMAAALVAPRVGANRSEAFCLGLLHDLGAALLHQVDPRLREYVLLRSPRRGVHPVVGEHERFGISHPEAAQRVLSAWRFPPALADAVAGHHLDPRSAVTPLDRCLHAAKALVRDLPEVPPHEVPTDVEAALRAGRVLARSDERSLRAQVEEQAGQLAQTLTTALS